MENMSKETRMTEKVSEFIETWLHTSPCDHEVEEATQIYNHIMERFDKLHWLALGAVCTFGIQEGKRAERSKNKLTICETEENQTIAKGIPEADRIYVLQYQNKLKEQCLGILLAIVDDELYDKENIKTDVIEMVKTLNELEAIFPLYGGVAL
ncbi:hypothetical protein [Paenibacillus sp. F4]|uniref:hypothetical protein n=1 Tax=Paenibacillus sp. F4 TaxID=357385 RepID=UPI000C9F9CB9|nr:hypothetical protein [Paenibacillus sp. F4]PNQ78869.1 hypothetical protein C1T21_22745 [Paenibacillus sp. F4]